MFGLKRLRDSGHLVRLCLAYFFAYVGTGVAVKYFTEISPDHLSQIGYLINNTAGSVAFVFLVVLLLGWQRLAAPFLISRRAWPILVSGLCTAVVIPTTTLMYLLPISVMVAMVIMRGSIILVSRAVDAIQIHQGILKKQVSWEEELAVVFALLAIGTNLYGTRGQDFDFIRSRSALMIMAFYVTAYAIRIYVMNYFKNEAGAVKVDNRAFFTVEQVWAMFWMGLSVVVLCAFAGRGGFSTGPLSEFRFHVLHPKLLPLLSGVAYAGVAFFSVFIFMLRGRTATFAGVVNRLTSLFAGTTSTLILSLGFGSRLPTPIEWTSLIWIGVATALLARAELKNGSKPEESSSHLPRIKNTGGIAIEHLAIPSSTELKAI